VVVPDFQLTLAIGREGQNARLAARLTGARIDIHSDAEDSAAPGGDGLRPRSADGASVASGSEPRSDASAAPAPTSGE
jgi:N utilization substance protein A